MAQDVIITPADGEIEWQDNTTGVALIDIDANNNLSITNAGGNLSIGDGSSDVYIGNGIANVDLVFEQDGEIRGTGSQTLTLGTSGDTVQVGTGVDFLINGSLGIGTTPSYRFHLNNNGSTNNDAFYVDVGNYNGTSLLFEHTGASTPVPFMISKSGYSGSSQSFGILQLHMDHSVVGGGSNLYFTLDDSAGNVTEYGGIGAYIQDATNGSEDGALTFMTTEAGSARQRRMTILNNGNVGIGTNNPNRLLNISGATQTWATAPAIQFTSTTTSGANVRNWWVGPADSSYGNFHIFPSATQGGNPGSSSEAANGITIDYVGKVGIGTISPDYELEVSTSSNSRIAATSVTNSVVNHLQADSSGAYVGPLSNHSLFFKTNNTTKMTILSNGSVGIGISPSGSKVHIDNGLGNGSGVCLHVDGSGDIRSNSGGSLFFGAYDYAGSTYIRGYDTSSGLYFYVDGTHRVHMTNSTYALKALGATFLNSGSDVWNKIGNNEIDFARETRFGYSSSYRILQLGTVGASRAISIGVDVSSNASGLFGGDEIIFPNQREIITPNAANNGYLGLIATDNQNKVRIGNYRWNILTDTPGITIDTSASTNHVGIGTTGPGSTRLRVVNNGTGQEIFKADDGATAVIRAKVDGTVTFEKGNVGIGTDSPLAKLQVLQQNQKFSLLIGADSGADSITNATNKFSRLGMPHYTNAEEPLTLLTGTSQASISTLFLGGGTSYGNAVTNIQFLTGANTTTTNGTLRMILDSGGNLGIGTPIPASKLDVRSATAYTLGVAYIEQGLATNSPTLQVLQSVSGGNPNVDQGLVVKVVGTSDGSGNSFHVYQRDNTSTGLVVKGSGNVGIGTGVPQDKFHVRADGNATNGLRVSNDSTGTSARTVINMYNNAGSAAGLVLSGSNYSAISGWANRLVINTDSLISNGIMVRPATGGFKVSASGTHNNDFYVASYSNVGVGTDSPERKFHVQGDAIINGGQGTSTFNDLSIGGINGWSNNEAHRINFVYGSTGQTIFQTIESHYNSTAQGRSKLRFRNLYNNSGANTDISMTILGDGNVGIGSDQPSYKLHVVGNSYIDATSANPTLTLGRYSGQPTIQAGSDDGGYLIMDSSGAGTGRAALNWYSSDHVVLANGGGNVGIGITPSAKLHVNGGTIAFANMIDNTDSVQITRSATIHTHQDCKLFIFDNSNSDWGQIVRLGGSSSYGLKVDQWVDYGFALFQQTIGQVFAARTSSIVINEDGGNYDFRVEGDTDQNLLVCDASADRVGIGFSSPSYKLSVNGDAYAQILVSNYTRLGSAGNFSTSTSNTAGWYPLAKWGTSSGNRGGFVIYVSYTGANWGPTTYVIKVFKDWGGTGTILVEKYGGNNYITDVRIIADSSSVYHLELYLISQTVGHNFDVRYEGMGYDESGTSTMILANTSLALSTNTGTVAASMNLGMGQGLATTNALVRDNLYLGTRMYHHGDNDTYLGFNTNETFLVAGSINGLHLYSTEAVVNENGANFNFRVEGDADVNLLVCDASADRVGIGTASPARKLDLTTAGQMTFGDNVTANSAQGIYWHSSDGYGIYRTSGGWSSPDYQQLQIKFVTGIILHPGSGAYGRSHVGVVGGVSIGSSYYSTMKDNGLIVEGNVGIGTTDPTERLHVYVGNASAPTDSNTHVVIEDSDHSYLGIYGGTGSDVGIHLGDTAIDARIAYHNSSRKLAFYAGGAGDQMTIDSSGNVGIGTTSPSYKLDVVGAHNTVIASISDGTDGVQFATRNTDRQQIDFLGSNTSSINAKGSLWINYDTDNNGAGDAIVFGRNGADEPSTIDMIINEGKVGIGTASPTYLLDLESNATGLTHNLKLNKSSTTGDYAEIAFQLWNGAGTGLNTFGGSGNSRPSVVLRAINENGNSASGAFVIGTFTGGSTNATLTEKFRITSAGSVGIGTTSPDHKLQVNGTVSIRPNGSSNNQHYFTTGGVDNAQYIMYNSGGSDINRFRTDSTSWITGGSVGIGTKSPSSPLAVKSGTNTDAEFYSESTGIAIQAYNRSTSSWGYVRLLGGGGEAMRVHTNNYVGIGSAGPTERLYVNGNIAISSTAYKIGFRDGSGMDVYIQFDDSNPSYSVAGTNYYTGGGMKIVGDKSSATQGDSFLRTEVLDVLAITATDGEFSDDLEVNGSIGVGGNLTTSRVVTITNISSSERPAIKIVNPNFSTNTSSTGKTFYRWLPIDIDGTTRWIAIYS